MCTKLCERKYEKQAETSNEMSKKHLSGKKKQKADKKGRDCAFDCSFISKAKYAVDTLQQMQMIVLKWCPIIEITITYVAVVARCPLLSTNKNNKNFA